MNTPSESFLPRGTASTSSGLSIYWIDFGEARLEEPFFHQTLYRLMERKPPAAEILTGAKELLRRAMSTPGVTPAGIIFHVSRCGSTLLAAGLRRDPCVTVFAEAPPIGSLLTQSTLAFKAGPPGGLPDIARPLVNAVVSLFANHHGTCKAIIKCHPANLLEVDYIRAIWPAVPFVVLTRNPVEVMVSNHLDPSGWVRARHVPIGTQSLFGWAAQETNEMTLEDYMAMGLREFFQKAIGLGDQHCLHVDYEDIDENMIRAVARRFGLSTEAFNSSETQALWRLDAKDPAKTRAFEPDAQRKQAAASPAIREAAERWAAEPYAVLRARSKSVRQALGHT